MIRRTITRLLPIALCSLMLALPQRSLASYGEYLHSVHFNAGRPDFGTIPRRMPLRFRGEYDVRPSASNWGNYEGPMNIDPAFQYEDERDTKREKAFRALLQQTESFAGKNSWQDAARAIERYTAVYGWTGMLRDRWQVVNEEVKQPGDRAQAERVRRYLRVQAMAENGWTTTAEQTFSALYQEKAAGFLRPFALYRLACSQYDKEKMEAMSLFQRVVTEFPGSIKEEDALIMVARSALLFEDRDHQAARQAITTLLSRYPKTRFRHAAEGLQARSQFLNGDYTAAANSYVRLGDVVSLETTLRKLPERLRARYYPEQLTGYLKRLDRAQTSYEYEQAITAIDRTLQVLTPSGASRFVKRMLEDPTIAAPYFYYRLYHTADGYTNWLGTVEEENNWDHTQEQRRRQAKNRMILRKRNESLTQLADRLAARHPNALPPLVTVRLAEVYYRQGDHARAQQWADRAIAQGHPTDGAYDRALYIRGAVHHRQRQYTAAIADFNTLLARCPQSPIRAGAREELALLYEQTDNLAAALDQYFTLDYRFDVAYLLDARMTTAEVAVYLATHPQGIHRNVVQYSLGIRYLREEDLSRARRILASLPSHPMQKGTDESNHGDYFTPPWQLGDKPHRARQQINELMELRRQAATAKTATEKAEALYREASYLYRSDQLTYYNALLWNEERSWFFGTYWNKREERRADTRAVHRHMYEHEVYWRVRQKCLTIAGRYPHTLVAPRALYRAACAVERLANLNNWWREEASRAHLDGEAARLMRTVYERYPHDRLAGPARKYAKVFAGYRNERIALLEPLILEPLIKERPDTVL